jgi:phosphomethylpyrimidine synthase
VIRRRFEFRRDPFNLSLAPVTALAYHNETTRRCRSGGRDRALLQHVPPKFCSMKITQDVRDYAARLEAAETGMAQKSAEFRERGGEVYLPADVVRADADSVDAEETVAAD